VRLAVVSQLRTIDESLAKRVADGLGLKALPAAVKPVVPVQDLDLSPALRLIDRMKDTLEGRTIGILIADGSNNESINAMKSALDKAGAAVKLVAQKRGVTLKDGSYVTADGQLAGTPSIVFDGVVSILPMAEAEKLVHEAAAVDWFRDAFGHLKAIAACKGTHKILEAAGIKPDAGVVAPEDIKAFIKLAKTRQWKREPTLRTLA
jgi:catalase